MDHYEQYQLNAILRIQTRIRVRASRSQRESNPLSFTLLLLLDCCRWLE